MLEEPEVIKDYEVVIRALLPGNVKATEYTIEVKSAKGLEGALEEAKAIWYKATETTDVRIKEIQKATKTGAE